MINGSLAAAGTLFAVRSAAAKTGDAGAGAALSGTTPAAAPAETDVFFTADVPVLCGAEDPDTAQRLPTSFFVGLVFMQEIHDQHPGDHRNDRREDIELYCVPPYGKGIAPKMTFTAYFKRRKYKCKNCADRHHGKDTL